MANRDCFIWILLFAGSLSSVLCSKSNSKFACEGQNLELDCGPGAIIQIKRANYGRFSWAICNDAGITEGWDVMCMSLQALDVVVDRCHTKESCHIEVNNYQFNDPCPDTFKYLEVQYSCKKVPTKSPPTTKEAPIKPTKPSKPTPKPKPTDRFCPATIARNIAWPRTLGGQLYETNCPEPMTGSAVWRCNGNGEWAKEPDLSDCVSKPISDIINEVEQGGDVVSATSKLDKATNDESELVGGDLIQSTALMNTIVKNMKKDIANKSVSVTVISKVTENVVTVSSNVLSDKHSASWKDLPPEEQQVVASTMLKNVEESAFQVASIHKKETKITTVTANIVVQVNVIEITKVTKLVFPDPAEKITTVTESSISLPAEALKDQGEKDGLVKIVFAEFDKINDYMDPKVNDSKTIINTNIISASINEMNRNIPLRRPVVMTMKHKQTKGVGLPSCVFWKYGRTSNDGYWATDGCRLLKTSNKTHSVCSCDHLTNFAVLMDVVGTKISDDHNMALQIITYAGCIVSIVCLFLAFLTFACFRNLQCDRNTIHKNLVLTLMIGEIIFLCGIAQYQHRILCAVIAGFLHFFFLCAFAWMCLEGVQLYVMLIEVFEAERSRVKWYYLLAYGAPAIIVGISAAVDHQGYGTERHCWLRTDTSFIWAFVGPVMVVITVNIIMLSIAIYMMCKHSSTVNSWKQKEKNRMRGKRASVQAPSTSTSFQSYDDQLTQSESKNNLKTCEANTSLTKPEEDSPFKKKLQETSAWIKGAAVLIVLLGLTWAFGLLYLDSSTIAMAYVFTIFNSLQGLFIFIFHCLMNDKVQKEYKKKVRRTNWCPTWIRVSYGGHTGLSQNSNNTPSRTSSNAGGLVRFLSNRRLRKKSSTTSLPKLSFQGESTNQNIDQPVSSNI